MTTIHMSLNGGKQVKTKTRFIAPLVGAIMIVGALAGCGGEQANSSGTAEDDFLKDRAAAPTITPDPNAPVDMMGGPGGMMGGGPGAIGEVKSIDGCKLTLSGPMGGTTTVVEVAEGTKIYRQGDAGLSDVKVGEPVIAMGAKVGETFTARNVQIGEELPTKGGPGGPVMIPRGEPGQVRPGNLNTPGIEPIELPIDGSRGNITGTMPLDPGMGGSPPEIAAGTVTRISGSEIIIKKADGTEAEITVNNDTSYQKRTEIPLSDLKTGETVIASGEKVGEVLKATELQVLQIMMRRAP
jgi:hypothetical protein